MNAGAKAIAPEATLTQLLKRTKPAAQSLIVTLFGDCVSQHGDSLWLGSLIGLLDLFSIEVEVVAESRLCGVAEHGYRFRRCILSKSWDWRNVGGKLCREFFGLIVLPGVAWLPSASGAERRTRSLGEPTR